ncbi:homeobox-leucine zipper protein HDG11-like [Cajanus cajan]|uniref:homeobox-leucine zipper protein HDG11-like n=1 Tax=Cajanus cajan TaxID=3821 RepID=UPI00098DA1B3|nr:homeobox-leucine zipper protein HDG11-like [Cajanus cajan]
MDMTMAAAGGSGDEQKNDQNGKKSYRRHKSDQTTKLEELFSVCPHPDEKQRRQIAKDLGLEPKQVKFWFQNKRTQKKTQTERANNNALRVENERMYNENLVIRETLKNIICPSCGGPPYGDKGHEHSLEKLRLENARLNVEREKVSNLLTMYMEKPTSELKLESTPIKGSSSRDALILGSPLKLGVGSAGMNLGGSTSLSFQGEEIVSNPGSKVTKMEKTMMSQIAIAAKEELLRLLCTSEPLWFKSSIDQRFVLHLECYENLFPRINHFKNSKAHVESSKDSRIVKIQAKELVDMFLDSEKWKSFFPTIVTKAQTIEVLENGSIDSRSGTLLLMYKEMHVLSPLVPSREFYFLRYCQQLEAGVWVIADVSVDYMKGTNPHPSSWRFPSGCMVHEISNGACHVSWVEHVEVDEKIQPHQLYRYIVNNNIAYGAKRWLTELQRMCERFISVGAEYISNYDIGGVITTIGGRKGIMKLSLQMVKNFYGFLNMSSNTNFPQHLTEGNNRVTISAQKNTNPSQPNSMITITAATSFWLPLPSQNLYDFFRDPIRRAKWDVMCYKNSVQEIARISSGTHPSNYISIIQPVHPTMNNVVMIQESSFDPLGSYVVYSPLNILDIRRAINGEDSSTTSIFPSGIVILDNEQSITNAPTSSSGNGILRTRGSLLTVAFQILMNSPTTTALESVAVVNSLITSTVKNIKDALMNGSNLEF